MMFRSIKGRPILFWVFWGPFSASMRLSESARRTIKSPCGYRGPCESGRKRDSKGRGLEGFGPYSGVSGPNRGAGSSTRRHSVHRRKRVLDATTSAQLLLLVASDYWWQCQIYQL